MYPILFQLGPLEIHSYTVLVDIGIVIGTIFAYYEARRLGFKMTRFVDMVAIVIVSAILGARIYYIILNFPEFQADWTRLWQMWLGGLAFHGGLAGGILAAVIYCWRARLSVWQFGDIGAAGLALGQAFGRIGCFFAGCCYGSPAGVPWAVVFPHLDGECRHPTQIYEAVGYTGVFAVLWLIRKGKPFDGYVFLSYLMLHGLVRFVVEALRDDSVYLLGMKVAQLVALGEVALGMLLMAYFWRIWKHSAAGEQGAGVGSGE